MVAILKNWQRREIIRDGDLVPDNRLASGATDLLEHDAIARGVAEIAWTADAPVNIALFGAWGSGKSSVYSMIDKHLKRIAPGKVRIARYDAWKYGGRELKRNFIDSIAHALKLNKRTEFSDGLENEQVQAKLNTWWWLRNNWGSLLLGVLVSVALAAIWVALQAVVAIPVMEQPFPETVQKLLPQAGTVFGLALVATLVGPKVFEGAVRTVRTPAPEGSDQFAKRFGQLVDSALRGGAKRLVVFIDELDRCDPKDVVATLIDLKTFLDQKNCVFIVAADRDVIEKALRETPQAKPVREDEPYYATPGAFLDKIFQHQLALPPLRSRALTKFAHDLVDDQGGIWEELRNHGQDVFDRAVFALIPVHVRSPRRVKVLLNNFATNARIAGSRGIVWSGRVHEIAVLTVLQTEFPTVADALRRVPRLLVYLRGEETTSSREIEELVRRYGPVDVVSSSPEPSEKDFPEEAGETPAGHLLSDDSSKEGHRERDQANLTMRLHLTNYLAKVKAASIRDPRPDLLYLQAAAGREDLPDPQLGDMIDLATDTAPDAVVAAFEAHESATLAVAIPLLVIEGDNETNPGRGFAYESACRLIEVLDPDEYTLVAGQVAPSLIAAITKEELPDAALPGALLAARWAGDTDVVRDRVRRLSEVSPTNSLLNQLTITIPHLDSEERQVLIRLIAGRFASSAEPLLSVLQSAPLHMAIEVWAGVSKEVVAALNEFERPKSDDDPAEESATNGTEADSVAHAGEGVSQLEELVRVVQNRPDHELLLSEVLASIQLGTAIQPLREWVGSNADHLVGTMSSTTLRARHAFLGLRRYPKGNIPRWSALLPDHAEVAPQGASTGRTESAGLAQAGRKAGFSNADLESAAADLLATLLKAAGTTSAKQLGTLKTLVLDVSSWAHTSQDDLAAAISSSLEKISWEGGAESDDDRDLLWQRKEALFEISESLAEDHNSPVYGPFREDLSELLRVLDLSEYTVDQWVKLAIRLPEGAAEELSKAVDNYEQREGEQAAVLRMKMAVRAVFGGSAPPVTDLVAIPEVERTTALTESWIDLSPSVDEVRTALSKLRISPTPLRRYCSSITTDQRTEIWLDLLAGGTDTQLQAAGESGVSQLAVDRVRELIATKTREPDRTAAAERLRQAKPAKDANAAVRKSISELAEELLTRDTGGDLRTAAELISWAGGPGRGHVKSLRQKFTDGVAKREKALPKKTIQKLVNHGLLLAPKKSLIASILGR